MSALITTVITLGSIFTYVAIGAAVFVRLRKWRATEHPNGCPGWYSMKCEACEMLPGLGAIFWPLVLPAWVGTSIGKGKRIHGFKARRAIRIARKIAKMEREIFGDS